MKVALFCVIATLAVYTTTPLSTSTDNGLRCRRCLGASTLNDCTFSIPCEPDEICYLDEIITDYYQVKYNAGCRIRDVCKKRPTGVGKKREEATGLVSCSHCCDIPGTPECNTRLCGIQPGTGSTTTTCYSCHGVANPSTCMTLSTCRSDEVCGTEEFRDGSLTTYNMNCMNRRLCTLLTKQSLQERKRCEAGGFCPFVGRRSTQKMCTACCGDALCNGNECNDLIDQLYTLWENNVLDFNTLKRTGNRTGVI